MIEQIQLLFVVKICVQILIMDHKKLDGRDAVVITEAKATGLNKQGEPSRAKAS